MRKPILLLAFPRSGTQALSELLYQKWNYYSVGEIFHDQYDQESNFYHWQKSFAIKILADKGNLVRLNSVSTFEAYMQYLLEECVLEENSENIIIDVKYSSINQIVNDWSYFDSMPVIITYFKQRGYPIIHLTRKNSLAAVFSLLIAQKIGHWKYEKGMVSDTGFMEFELNIEEIYYFLDRLNSSKAFFNSALQGYGRSVDLIYENIFGEGVDLNYLSGAMRNVFEDPNFNGIGELNLMVTPKNNIRILNINELISILAKRYPDADEQLEAYGNRLKKA